MCLSRFGVRSISGFNRALRMNGATALTRCTSSSSTDGTSASSQSPRIASAQIDLLQILIEPALGEKIAIVREFLRQQRNLRQLARHASDPSIGADSRSRDADCFRQHVIAAQSFERAEELALGLGERVERCRSPTPSCARKTPAGGARSGRRC